MAEENNEEHLPWTQEEEYELQRKLRDLLMQLGEAVGELKERLPVPQVRMQMVSPPPSPPEGWEPTPETGPNKIAFVDLKPSKIDDNTTLLLPETDNTPRICLHLM